MATVLGLNAFHADAAACIVREGRLIAAAEEERFRRIKHWAGCPTESVRWCLKEAGISLSEIDHIAVNQDANANLWRKVAYLVGSRPELSLVAERLRNRREREGIHELLGREFGVPVRAEVHAVEHHVAHLSSAFHVSPFDRAVALSIDGFGDFASAAWGLGSGTTLVVDDRIYFPHSLGIFYQALTQYLGFPHYGDEYKVMGLAPYGEPVYVDAMRKIVNSRSDGGFELNLSYFRHHKEKISFEWEGGIPEFQNLYTPELETLLGPARGVTEPLTQKHKDIARSVQAMYEEAFFSLLRFLHARYKVDALCLAGGCAMNSVANGKIYRNTPFTQLYVQSAAGDAGGAVGAAFVVAGEVEKQGCGRQFVMNHAYWGPEFNDSEIEGVIGQRSAEIEREGCSVRRVSEEEELLNIAVRRVAAGCVVGWFQGRMEWGPRALGNRSIICDPRRSNMKDILNLKIKRRESFRPFAPSILRESVAEWFEVDDDVPFMMQVYPIRIEKRAQVPAITHVDGSGRLQTVTRAENARYYKLIERFGAISGVPMILNTSFNENEPVVCRPEEALDCFLRTKMDLLVMGNWTIERGTATENAVNRSTGAMV